MPLALSLSLAACGAGPPGAAAVEVRDSAGIRIVEHGVDPWSVAPEWRIDPDPILDLGVVDGDSNYMFYRVTDASRLTDGRIVVANGGSGELRFFAADGAYQQSVGRQGEGPGEFRVPANLWRLANDTLAVFDPRTQRYTILSADGELVRTAQLEPRLLNADVRGALSGRTVLMLQRWLEVPRSGSSMQMQYVHLFRYALDGQVTDSLGRYPWLRMGRLTSVDLVGGPEFQPTTVTAGAGGTVYIGSARDHEFAIHEASGALRALVRWAGDDLTVTAADREAYRERLLGLADSPEDRRRTQAMIEEAGFSDTRPAYEWLETDAAGNVWVQAFRFHDSDAPFRWAVFAPDGQLLGRVQTPRRLRIFEIGARYVLGVARDELDVEHVRLYRLTRS